MSQKAILIIGNGVAGTMAAETIRQKDPEQRVVVVTDEAHPLYNRVLLPHFLKLMVPESRLFMRSSESYKEKGIEFRCHTRVKSISLSEKIALTDDAVEIPYEKLLIATGGRPNRLQVEGSAGEGVFNLQYLDDALKLGEALMSAKSAVAVGGGFIGYEFANAFAARNLRTTWLIRGPRFLHRALDEEAGSLVDTLAKDAGIHTIYGDEAAAIQRRNGMPSGLTTRRGEHIEGELVGCGLGITRNLDFLQGTDIPVGGGVLTDRFLKTHSPDIFAAGDVAEFEDVTIGRQHLMGTWSNAAPQGRIAGVNILGEQKPFQVIPTCVNPLFRSHIRLFGLTHDLPADAASVKCLEMSSRKYQRLFFKDNRLVGAVAIGPLRGEIRKRWLDLMVSRREVSAHEGLLNI